VFKAKPLELAYLSWGHRWYGEAPANARAHDGWHYFTVLAGNPALHVNGRTLPTQPGLVNVAHPECVVGHSDLPTRRCEMLTWVWRTPPGHSALRPEHGESLRLKVDHHSLRRLKQLHVQCREAVARANERSHLQMLVSRLQMDLCLLDGLDQSSGAVSDFQLDLAVEFLRSHLDEPEPVSLLCEYLHLSEASLKRLFHLHTGRSPREFVFEWRMRWAREELQRESASVKSVAYALGYRHPNDFSRAFKRFHGRNARDLLNQ